MTSIPTKEFIDIVKSARTTVIAFPSNSSLDTLSAGIALYQALKDRQNIYLYSDKLHNQEMLPLSQQIQTSIPNQKLIISIPDNQVDNVTTQKDGITSDLEITIHPKPGTTALNHQDLKFSYKLPKIELLITFDDILTHGEQYPLIKQIIDQKPQIINLSLTQSSFPSVNLNIFSNQLQSVSLLTYQLLSQISIVNADIATTLLAGIQQSTSNFSKTNISPETFEAVADLLRRGGKRPGQQTTYTVSSSPSNNLETTQTTAPTPIEAPRTNQVPRWLNPPALHSQNLPHQPHANSQTPNDSQ